MQAVSHLMFPCFSLKVALESVCQEEGKGKKVFYASTSFWEVGGEKTFCNAIFPIKYIQSVFFSAYLKNTVA